MKGKTINFILGIRYSKMDQVKFVEDGFKKFEGVCRGTYIPLNFLKAVFHKFHLVHP